jgi:hypothetical protein
LILQDALRRQSGCTVAESGHFAAIEAAVRKQKRLSPGLTQIFPNHVRAPRPCRMSEEVINVCS